MSLGRVPHFSRYIHTQTRTNTHEHINFRGRLLSLGAELQRQLSPTMLARRPNCDLLFFVSRVLYIQLHKVGFEVILFILAMLSRKPHVSINPNPVHVLEKERF